MIIINKYTMLTVFLALFMVGCQQNPIGGQRDDYGCLVGAGYSFDKDVGACVRNWEFGDHEKQVARNVVMVQSYSSFTITGIEKVDNCSDCYDVTIQRNPVDEETKKEKYMVPIVVPYREGRDIGYYYNHMNMLTR